MANKYSYSWFSHQFEDAKRTAEAFITSTDENLFLQPPSSDKWSAAQCYSHLIQFGNLYLHNLSSGINRSTTTIDNQERSFRPRWIVRKAISFLSPPYNIKIPTIKQMEPDPNSGFDKEELLTNYLGLQDRFISQLNKAQNKKLHLNAMQVPHPVFSYLSMTLSEYFAIIEVHQRRHQWQARETVEKLKIP